MHITEYFVILYSELQEIMNKFKVAYIHHQSLLNLENDMSNYSENISDSEPTKRTAKEPNKEAAKEATKDAAKEATKEATKEASYETSKDTHINSSNETSKEAESKEEEINIKEIYRKLLFIFHPDKSISPNEQIFGEIKKAWDDKYEPTIIYYFIKNSNHPMLKIIYEKLHNTKGFLIFLKNICNMITKEINDIRRTPIWNKYYNLRKY
jgi:hypothetical protein